MPLPPFGSPPWGNGAAGPAAEVYTDPEKPWLGQCLRAKRSVPAGGLLVKERYLAFVSVTAGLRGRQKYAELHRAVTRGRHPAGAPEGSAWGSWGAGVDEIRDEALWTGDGAEAERVRAEMLECGGEAEDLAEGELEQAVLLACAFNLNSFSFGQQDGRREDVIFPTICRANHSCSPNAAIVPGGSPAEARLVAIRPIAPGEPVEICYFPADHLLRTTPQRRAALEEKFRFLCRCRRCEAELDRTRRFASACACGGDSFVAGRGTLCCIACGEAMGDQARAERLLAEEAEAERLLAGLPEPEDLQLPAPDGLEGLDAAGLRLCLDFAEAHASHHAAAEVARRRVPALHSEGQHAKAAEAQVAFVAAAAEALPKGACGLAWLVELHARLSLLLELAGRRREACEALRQVSRNLELATGRKPGPGAFFELLECAEWFRLLQEVGAEVLC